MIKKADIILSVALVILAVASVFLFTAFKKGGGTVRISMDNKVIGEYSLNQDQEISLKHNTIRIKNGKVAVFNADCRDQICVQRGEISSVGESIVCLPNSVVVEVR